MPIPQNAQAIYQFLTGAGLSPNAAAGILGNIEQESGGNPMAGSNPPGRGLIQKLGDPGGSLSSELQVILSYIKANGSISDINAHATSPSAAALYFSQRYERPSAAAANNANREASANEVAQAAKTGNWSTAASATTTGFDPTGIGALASSFTGFFGQFGDMFTLFHNVISPGFWLRVGMFFAGIFLLAFGVYALVKADSDSGLIPKMPNVTPVPVPI